MQRYLTAAKEFELLRCALPPGVSRGRIYLTRSSSSAVVVLSLGSEARVFEESSPAGAVMGRAVELSPTESAVVNSGTEQFVVELSAGGAVYVAGVPGAITCTGVSS